MKLQSTFNNSCCSPAALAFEDIKVKMIVKKARDKGNVAGIHNGSVQYLKEMIKIGFQFTSLLSDFRIMSSHAENLLKEIKNVDTKSDNTSAY